LSEDWGRKCYNHIYPFLNCSFCSFSDFSGIDRLCDNAELAAVVEWLKAEDESRLERLWQAADQVRRENVGDGVHLRGLLEISNYCVRRCAYCGINTERKGLQRYRMSQDEILAGAGQAAEYGYGTVVIQAGEDYGITAEWLGEIIRTIKSDTALAVTLSMGERPVEDYRLWKEAGADRVLLRLETTDEQLYERIHPSSGRGGAGRKEILEACGQMGYEIGSGVMVGIPGQSYESLGRDILTFDRMDLDMIGVGPYIAHPDTRLGGAATGETEQVPATELMTYKVVSLSRLVRPDANIPGTSALATLNIGTGRENALCRGANVVMPNLTPVCYRSMYEIYPAKACINETAVQCRDCLRGRIESLGRYVAAGPGNRVRKSVNGNVLSRLGGLDGGGFV